MLTEGWVTNIIIIINYHTERREYKKNENSESVQKIYIVSEEDSVCPLCIGELTVIGSRDRILIYDTGDKETLVIRRLRCVECGKIHHELPDIIIPYKRHCADTIEKIISGKNDICCDYVTEHRIKTWWAAFNQNFENAKMSIKMKYNELISSKLTPRKIVRLIINLNLWVHTRTAMTPV